MKKKILILVLIFSVLTLSFLLSSCSKGTEGLEFVEINDDEYGVKCGEAINESEIVIPSKHDGKKVTTILKSGFSKCENLVSVTIPKSVTKMETGAFLNCDKLENVYYGGKIKDWCNIEFEHSTSNPMSVGENFFIKNKAITEISVKNTDTIKAYAFFGFENLTKAEIEDVTTIGDSAFAGCINLSESTLPSNLEYVSKLVFSGCVKLKEITIPSNVSTIHPLAFYGCSGLKSVTFENTGNWFIAEKESDIKGGELIVTDNAQNAKDLVKSHSEFWKRSFTE